MYVVFGQVLDSLGILTKSALLLVSRMPENKIYAFDSDEISSRARKDQ